MNVFMGAVGALGCLMGLIALAGAASGEAEEGTWVEVARSASFRTYVEMYVVAASLCSIGFIVGGLGLTREARWGRAVSGIAAVLLLALLVGGNIAGRTLSGGVVAGGMEPGRRGMASNISSIALQLVLAAYGIFMLVRLSQREARAK